MTALFGQYVMQGVIPGNDRMWLFSILLAGGFAEDPGSDQCAALHLRKRSGLAVISSMCNDKPKSYCIGIKLISIICSWLFFIDYNSKFYTFGLPMKGPRVCLQSTNWN